MFGPNILTWSSCFTHGIQRVTKCLGLPRVKYRARAKGFTAVPVLHGKDAVVTTHILRFGLDKSDSGVISSLILELMSPSLRGDSGIVSSFRLLLVWEIVFFFHLVDCNTVVVVVVVVVRNSSINSLSSSTSSQKMRRQLKSSDLELLKYPQRIWLQVEFCSCPPHFLLKEEGLQVTPNFSS